MSEEKTLGQVYSEFYDNCGYAHTRRCEEAPCHDAALQAVAEAATRELREKLEAEQKKGRESGDEFYRLLMLRCREKEQLTAQLAEKEALEKVAREILVRLDSLEADLNRKGIILTHELIERLRTALQPKEER